MSDPTKSRFVDIKVLACIEVPPNAKQPLRADAVDHITDLLIALCEDRGWYFGGGVEVHEIDADGKRVP